MSERDLENPHAPAERRKLIEPQLHDPPQPADVCLHGMDYMPFYPERFHKSRALRMGIADPAGGFAMILLLAEAWEGSPAGSLENDDLILAGAAHCSLADWEARKCVALYGWTLCNDGRLYHPVLCEIAWATWQDRLKARHKQACDRMALANKRAGVGTRHGLPTFEAWVSEAYPLTAAKLFAAAAPAAAVNSAAVLGGNVATTTSDVAATPSHCRVDSALKVKVKGTTPPLTPPADQAEPGQEWQRRADFTAYLAAVDQPEAPTESCWRAWLEVVRDLPEQRVLLALVMAWRAHHDELNAGRRHKIRPLGPARLLREGTLNNFVAQAEALLAAVDQSHGADAAERAKAIWGDLYMSLVDLVGGESVFLSWFSDARPQRDGAKLIILSASAARRNWIKDHFQDRIARGLGFEVETRLIEPTKEAT